MDSDLATKKRLLPKANYYMSELGLTGPQAWTRVLTEAGQRGFSPAGVKETFAELKARTLSGAAGTTPARSRAAQPIDTRWLKEQALAMMRIRRQSTDLRHATFAENYKKTILELSK